MRVKEISVSRLFGLFNHVIPMKMADRVTIITSPNGYGKTTMLRLVHSLFAGRYSEVRRTPFRDFRVSFEDGTSLQVVRVESAKTATRSQGTDLTVTLFRGSRREEQTTIQQPPRDAFPLALGMIERALPNLSRSGPSLWKDRQTGREMDYEEVFRTYAQYFGNISKEMLAHFAEAPWLTKFRQETRIKLIESQRLLKANKRGENPDEEPWRPAVLLYSSELATLIRTKLAEYATLSQSLDRSFPKRLVEKTNAPDKKTVSIRELRKRLQELENKRIALTSFGLLDKEDERFDLPGMLDDQTLTNSVLPVYAEDAEQKLRVFDEIAAKINLLTTIVKAHFQFKFLTIDKEKGFQFYTDYPSDSNKPRPLLTARLSSGEQHMLVLLYELLFTVEPGSLVMIDEPEISLHVTWQLEFLRDIQRVTELSGFDALIATHAPAIISDRLDLKVDLEAPTE
jgi:AAA domain, putative AbiEii toxin, Type IV TA system